MGTFSRRLIILCGIRLWYLRTTGCSIIKRLMLDGYVITAVRIDRNHPG